MQSAASRPAEAIFMPSGLKTAAVTAELWPRSVCQQFPFSKSQTFTVSSPLAVTSLCPSGLKATVLT